MATVSGFKDNIYDTCVPVTITYETESFQINKGWIGGAFILGLVFGVLLLVFCVPVCIRDYFKKRVSINNIYCYFLCLRAWFG